jgi:hypothetical protein
MWTKNPISAIMARIIEMRKTTCVGAFSLGEIDFGAFNLGTMPLGGYKMSQLFNGEFLIINNIFD